jgi:hypothetical protein
LINYPSAASEISRGGAILAQVSLLSLAPEARRMLTVTTTAPTVIVIDERPSD